MQVKVFRICMCIYWANARLRGRRGEGFATFQGCSVKVLNRQSDLKRLALITNKRPVNSDDALTGKGR